MEREQRSKYREQFAFGVKTFEFELTLPGSPINQAAARSDARPQIFSESRNHNCRRRICLLIESLTYVGDRISVDFLWDVLRKSHDALAAATSRLARNRKIKVPTLSDVRKRLVQHPFDMGLIDGP
jgi:hypothetical protein